MNWFMSAIWPCITSPLSTTTGSSSGRPEKKLKNVSGFETATFRAVTPLNKPRFVMSR